MSRLSIVLLFIFLSGLTRLKSQEASEAEIYLITCGPGTETYSIYGHTALRIVIPSKDSDLVYNWGVFDFSTPNFAWKFAKGRLEYMLGVYPFNNFLQDYFMEERWVEEQRINLEQEEIEILFRLITENLKPENRKYRYDFFYDNCSTRVRDLLEKAVGEDLLYPTAPDPEQLPSFRDKTGEYQKPYTWLNLGIDLLMGSPGDKKASLRDRMFLPIELQIVFSEAQVSRDDKTASLLGYPVRLIDFETPSHRPGIITSPLMVFSLLLIVMILVTLFLKGKNINLAIDILIFMVFSMLAVLMLFFNIFTLHQQMKSNFNIIWLNPFIILCLFTLLFRLRTFLWFRLTFFLLAVFILTALFLPQFINPAFFPLMIILLIRSLVRSDFKWNPFNLPHLTQL
ncbi:MAG: DUF4105 domain-containing protein [Bacteroidales bacterium]|nr:DUF4105 domain-containing protein [Bacteroidales bacterium]